MKARADDDGDREDIGHAGHGRGPRYPQARGAAPGIRVPERCRPPRAPAGRPRSDVPVGRLLRQVSDTVVCDERLAGAGGALRARARGSARPSGIDAIVAAVAVARQPSVVLTTDPDDLSALLAAAMLVR